MKLRTKCADCSDGTLKKKLPKSLKRAVADNWKWLTGSTRVSTMSRNVAFDKGKAFDLKRPKRQTCC